MAKHPDIPDQYNTVMPYLILKGADRFIEFAKQVFGAAEIHREMRDDQTVRHAQVVIGDSTIMCSEAKEEFKPHNGGFFIYVDNADEAFDRALKAGATEVMKVSHQPYGRSGGVLDPFGNTWWVTSVPENPA